MDNNNYLSLILIEIGFSVLKKNNSLSISNKIEQKAALEKDKKNNFLQQPKHKF